jgi:O-antigen/teichoic acid export membrane protein
MIGRLVGLRNNSSVRNMSGAFMLRGVVTITNLALVTLAARTLGKHDFGTYSILFSAAGLCSVIATFGQQVFMMRAWSEYSAAGQQQLLKGAMTFSALTCLAGAALIGLPFYGWLSLSHDALLAISVTLYLVTYAIMLTSSHLVRTAIGVMIGDGYSNLLVAVPPILYLLGCAALHTEPETYRIFLSMAAGASIAVLIQLTMMRRKLRSRFPQIGSAGMTFELPAWSARSLKLWVSNGLEASNQYADVVIIGYLMSPSIAGAYFVTTRIANAFAMATGAIYIVSARQFPNLYYQRKFRQLDAMLDSIAVVTLAIIVAGMLVILGGGHWILRAFSEEYVSYYGALALLSFGTAAIAAAGPSGSILMLTGHEGRYLAIIGGTVLMRSIGFFVLIPLFGIIGAVAATAISFVWMALLLRGSAKSAAGIDGSVLRLFTKFNRRRVSLPAE